IETRLQLSAAQRASLTALVDASAKASDMLKEACQPDATMTAPARLTAIGNRLAVMQLAIKTVLAGLDDFYDQLTEEQKVEFETIGPANTTASEGQAEAGEPAAPPPRRRGGRPHASLG